VDGFQSLHDSVRKDRQGNPTYSRVSKAFRMLHEKGVEANILCVVTGNTARHGQAVYEGLKNLGCRYMQFIPCLDPVGEVRGAAPYSLRPERYADFLKAVFDLWYEDWKAGNYHSVRLFDDYAMIAAGMRPSACATSGRCGLYAVVEADGSIFPCDFYVSNEWLLGNITQLSFSEILGSTLAEQFVRESFTRPTNCAGCKYFRLCRGGCKRDWVADQADVENYHCRAFKSFFDYAYDRFMIVADAERHARDKQ
jgi:uncharacterized protein